MPVFGQLHRSLFLVNNEVTVFRFFTTAGRELWDQLIDLAVQLGAIFSCTRDNEWRPRLIDEN